MRLLIMALLTLILTIPAHARYVQVYFDHELSQNYVTEFKLSTNQLLTDGDTLEVFITSPGGYVAYSLDLYNYLCSLHRRNIYVITHASGICCSGAVLVLQAGDLRVIDPYTIFMVHSSGTSADVPAWNDFFGWKQYWKYSDPNNAQKVNNDNIMYNLISARNGMSYQAVKEDLSFDNYLRADRAILHRYADKYGYAKLKKDCK